MVLEPKPKPPPPSPPSWFRWKHLPLRPFAIVLPPQGAPTWEGGR